VTADETFFLGGIEKTRVLKVLRPHIFFDDQMTHLASSAGVIPSVHIPFGANNVAPNKALVPVATSAVKGDASPVHREETTSLEVPKRVRRGRRGR
jgi:hypothetical protein